MAKTRKKKEEIRRIPVKRKSADKYVGRPNKTLKLFAHSRLVEIVIVTIMNEFISLTKTHSQAGTPRHDNSRPNNVQS